MFVVLLHIDGKIPGCFYLAVNPKPCFCEETRMLALYPNIVWHLLRKINMINDKVTSPWRLLSGKHVTNAFSQWDSKHQVDFCLSTVNVLVEKMKRRFHLISLVWHLIFWSVTGNIKLMKVPLDKPLWCWHPEGKTEKLVGWLYTYNVIHINTLRCLISTDSQTDYSTGLI